MRVIAFGASMPVAHFIAQIGPMLCFPVRLLLVAATLAQIAFLFDPAIAASRSI